LPVTDGNKEAAKELLATFRTLFTMGLTILLLEVNLRANGWVVFRVEWALWASMLSLGLGCAVCVPLFLRAIPMLYNEIADIAYDPTLVKMGLVTLTLFALGLLTLLFAQLGW
jgi:hypothetical protein